MKVDPNMQQPTSRQATAFLEREITAGLGARAGFVYLAVRNLTSTFQPFRPASAYTVPFNVTDPGEDGRVGTGDDGLLTFYGIPNSQIANYPNTSVVSNTPNNGTYKIIEFAMSKL